ncbi:hypothetical protein CPC08DRAFT_78845 [Agrocybe pediades]|nr:hypothetical protein CPC08DRAFT_78845 [Agrocybe pediades]
MPCTLSSAPSYTTFWHFLPQRKILAIRKPKRCTGRPTTHKSTRSGYLQPGLKSRMTSMRVAWTDAYAYAQAFERYEPTNFAPSIFIIHGRILLSSSSGSQGLDHGLPLLVLSLKIRWEGSPGVGWPDCGLLQGRSALRTRKTLIRRRTREPRM